MAEGRRSRGNVFHFDIHGGSTAEESTTAQGDQLQGKEKYGLERGLRMMNLEQPESDRIARTPEKQQHKHQIQDQKTAKAIGKKVSRTTRGHQMKISLLRGKAYTYFQNGDYEEAKKILNDINSSQDFLDLENLLLLTECDLHLARRSAGKNIDRLHDTILSCSELKDGDIKSFGDELKKNGRKVGAILLYWISSDKYKTVASGPNDLITYVKWRTKDVADTVKVLIKSDGRSHAIVSDYVIELLTEMLDTISNTTEADAEKKALAKGVCLNSIFVACIDTEQYQQSIRFGSMGIEVFEKQFGANASKYQYYGELLHNMGDVYRESGRYAEAEKFYLKSYGAFKKAIDFDDEIEKQKTIEATKNNLAVTRKLLSQHKPKSK